MLALGYNEYGEYQTSSDCRGAFWLKPTTSHTRRRLGVLREFHHSHTIFRDLIVYGVHIRSLAFCVAKMLGSMLKPGIPIVLCTYRCWRWTWPVFSYLRNSGPPPSFWSFPLLWLRSLITPLTDYERLGLQRTTEFRTKNFGYVSVHTTKPQTLAYSLADSPAGLLAWIYEKLSTWTDDYPWTDDESELYLFVSS